MDGENGREGRIEKNNETERKRTAENEIEELRASCIARPLESYFKAYS